MQAASALGTSAWTARTVGIAFAVAGSSARSRRLRRPATGCRCSRAGSSDDSVTSTWPSTRVDCVSTEGARASVSAIAERWLASCRSIAAVELTEPPRFVLRAASAVATLAVPDTSCASAASSATTSSPSCADWLNAGFRYAFAPRSCDAVGWATKYAPALSTPWSEALTRGVSASSSVSRSTIPRVWVTGRTPPFGIGAPTPGLSDTSLFATPVRLS